jgi:hypothetical protein
MKVMSNATTKQLQKLQQVVTAAGEYLPAKSTLTLNGQSVTLAAFLTGLNQAITAFGAVTTARAQWASALSARQPLMTAALASVSALKQYLIVTYGKNATMLVQFGFAPKKPVVLTPEKKAIAVAQGRLTRKARGTMGPKAKLNVTAAGKPGLVLVAADGTPIPGVVQGPSAPGIAAPAAAPSASTPSKPTTGG